MSSLPKTQDIDYVRELFSQSEGKLWLVDGPNFSGRTHALKLITGAADAYLAHEHSSYDAQFPSAYISPEVYNALSGLCSTVEGELNLHSSFQESHRSNKRIAQFLELIGLDKLRLRNPFTLSGGEQACLTIACALAMQPKNIAIDCALEQLDSRAKRLVLNLLASDSWSETLIVLADNRSKETVLPESLVRLAAQESLTDFQSVEQFHAIDASKLSPSQKYTSKELEIRDLSFAYSPKDYSSILKNISISLQPGSIYVIKGLNGAGKSTLAKVLTGVLKPSLGKLLLAGNAFVPWNNPGRFVSYHFQNPDVQLFETSVEDEILVGMKNHMRECSEADKKLITTNIIAVFGLDRIRFEHPLDLPFTIRKRVALAASIAAATNWLILDEPTLGQDDQAAQALSQIIKQLAKSGLGIIVITHSEWLEKSLSGTQLILENGQLVVGN
jgi:energy-coupling factor transport system ATP-binding protein